MNQRINICNVMIDNIDCESAVKEILSFAGSKNYVYIVTPNIDHIIKYQKDSQFREIYYAASLVLTDGQPVMWASNILGTPLKEKISGSDLFPKLCEKASIHGYKLFFLGGKEGAVQRTSETLMTKYANIKIVGAYCPPFGFEYDEIENNKIINMIKTASPDILFIGVGSPKQEKWIYKHKNEYQVPVSIGIGATFDFMSGMVKRAPLWMQKAGLEWFWRLMMEPRRLWRRYLIDDPVFFWLVLKQKLGLLK